MTERFYELAGIRFRILGPKDCLRDSGQFLKNYDALLLYMTGRHWGITQNKIA